MAGQHHLTMRGLRALMEGAGLDALVVTGEDEHHSEYVSDRDKRRDFIAGFTGSAGTAVVTRARDADGKEHALLWTDGRYFLQAEKELYPGFKLMRSGELATPTIEAWLAKHVPPGGKIGVDAWTVSVHDARRWKRAFEAGGQELVATPGNLVDKLWTARPADPLAPVAPHPLEFAGVGVPAKLAALRKKLADEKAGAIVTGALDEVAWLFNLRGGDVECSPVFKSYAVVTHNAAHLFVDPGKCGGEALAAHLAAAGVERHPYTAFTAHLEALVGSMAAPAAGGAGGGEAAGAPAKIWADPATCSMGMGAVIAAASTVELPSPITLAKSVKNAVELDGIRAAHARDGAAMVRWLHWLTRRVAATDPGAYTGYFAGGDGGGSKNPLKRRKVAAGAVAGAGADAGADDGVEMTEAGVAEKLRQERAKEEHFVGLSFPTISSAGPNAAIIHYFYGDGEVQTPVDARSIFLCDSGGQYRDGTTDVTRTVHLGEPTPHEKECFTRVLQGHIGLASAVFPNGTLGTSVDAFARQALWRVGLDYRHGTGHGVGAFLNVHEGPHTVGQVLPAHSQPLLEGMTVTVEPGYYEDGAFGIRIENVEVVEPAATRHNFAGRGFLKLAPVTFVPIQEKLMDLSIMTPGEMDWVDEYHARTWEVLEGRVEGKDREWLRAATKPLSRPGGGRGGRWRLGR